MADLDFFKRHKELYSPSAKEPSIVDVRKFNFIMIDGKGDPNNSPDYQNAVEALYSVSYTLKFMPKKGITIPDYFDYKVGPLEGLWWLDDNRDFVMEKKDG